MVRTILSLEVVEVAKLGVDDVIVVSDDLGVPRLGIIFRLEKSGNFVMVEYCPPARPICTYINLFQNAKILGKK